MVTPFLSSLPADKAKAVIDETKNLVPEIANAAKADQEVTDQERALVLQLQAPPIGNQTKVALSDETLRHEMRVTEALVRMGDESSQPSKYDAPEKYEVKKLVAAVGGALEKSGPVNKSSFDTLLHAVMNEMKKEAIKPSTVEDKKIVEVLLKEVATYNKAHSQAVTDGKNVIEHNGPLTTPGNTKDNKITK